MAANGEFSVRAAARSLLEIPNLAEKSKVLLRDAFSRVCLGIETREDAFMPQHGRGWLVKGHRSTEWCPRCGTSLSQHELTQAGVYQDRADPSLFVRFPLLERSGESLVIWTTTPWTLPANVAAAVHPDEEYGRRENGEWRIARYMLNDLPR